ncbi:LLM class flavin-dependent oxidoreductase, partial [Streptomyces sp. SID10244]|nr:LLM class flavin-dependent oxidoreductase [Streptomyces sp. SID10244]
SDTEQRRDGDHADKHQRYQRSGEFIEVLRKAWTSTEPFDHHGEFYTIEDARSEILPLQSPHPPVFFGGSSQDAYRIGGAQADVFALWGEPLAQTREQIAAVTSAAYAAGREAPPSFSVSFRPIIAETDDAAWERAHAILDAIKTGRGHSFTGTRYSAVSPTNQGSQRLLEAAAAGEHHDRALWTATAAASGARGNSTALVGSPATVAAALLDYVDIGVD